jgi:hypothetical protein
MSAPREPHPPDIETFVSSLFRYADDNTCVSLRAFDQFDRTKPPVLINAVLINGEGLGRVVAEAVRGARETAGLAAPAVFAPPICTFTNAQRARGVDLANGLALSVEIDEGDTVKAQQRLEGLLGPATVIVASGGEWTDAQTGEVFPKLHLHWRLSEPTREAEDHAKLRQARELAARLVGADPTGKPVVHPLRWPGSWNTKDEPRLARIVALNDTAEIHLVEGLDALAEAIELAGLAKVDLPRSGTPTANVADIRDAMAAIPNAGTNVHYDDWIRFGYATYRATGGTDEGFAIWDDWSRRSEKYDPTETEVTWKRIRHAIEGSTAPRTIGAGTIFYHATHAGWQRPRPERSTAANSESVEPPPSLLDPWDGLQPTPFPLDALPNVLRAFVEDRARVIGADSGAIAWAAISACSSALDGRIRLQMKARDTWAVPPFFWLALVGAPSTRKTPILDAAWGPLQRAQAADIQAWRIAHARWNALPKKERAETPEPPCRRRLVSHDATIESIQDILGRQDRGLGLLRDELVY